MPDLQALHFHHDHGRIACAVVRAAQPQGLPALLMVHGLASNRTRWREFMCASALAQTHDLIAVDLRGHGEALTRSAIDTERWCADLSALLAHLGHRRAIVLGHSMGAQVALRFAARHTAMCAALVLIDPVFRAALRGRWRLLAGTAPLIGVAARVVRGLNAMGVHRGALPPLDLHALDEMARHALLSQQDTAAFIRRYSSARADLRHVPLAVYLQDLVEMFRSPPLPTGIPMLALLSRAATFADGARMAAALRSAGAQVRDIDCQHWPLTERPDEVRQLVDDWVGGLAVADTATMR